MALCHRKETAWTGIAKRFDLVFDDEVADAELDARYVFSSDNSRMLRQWIAGPTVRRAVDTLVLQQSVSLEIRQGRLIATWTAPIFGAFPGHFDAEKWSGVLHEMLELARSLESFGDGIRR